jgi:GR25 family glycosyltransferase involved in LPS biosynthesis
MGDIPVYVISLRDSEVRRRNMAARLNAAGIPFRFLDAIDGRRTPIPDVIDGAQVDRESFDFESGLACAASHRIAHRMVVDGDSDLALIFEDDAKLSDDFPETLAAAAKLDFDLFKFEGGPLHRYHMAIDRIGRYSVVAGMLPSMGAAAYLIRRSAAIRFCSLPVIDQPCDAAFSDLRLSLRVLELSPRAAVQDGETPPLLGYQPYPPRFRDSVRGLKRFARSVRRRQRVIDAYGIRVALAFELQRLASIFHPTRFRSTR